MARQNASNNSADKPEKRIVTSPDQFRESIETPSFQRALADMCVDPTIVKLLTKTAIKLIVRTPALQECTKLSILDSILDAADVGLIPGNSVLAHAYLVPYRDSADHQLKAQFQASWKGKAELARRSGLVSRIEAHEVRENDFFPDIEQGGSPKLVHRWHPTDDRGEIIAYYAVAFFKDGGVQFEVMSVAEIHQHRDTFSKQPQGKAWREHESAMARKTVIVKLESFLPLSREQERAHELDRDVPQTFTVDATTLKEETVAAEKAQDAPGRAGPEAKTPSAQPDRSRSLAAAQDAAIDLPALDRNSKTTVPARPGTSGGSPPDRPEQGEGQETRNKDVVVARSAAPEPNDDPGPCEKSRECLKPNGHTPPCSDGFDLEAEDRRRTTGAAVKTDAAPAAPPAVIVPPPPSEPFEPANKFHNADRVRVKKTKAKGTVIGYRGTGPTAIYRVKLDDIGDIWEFSANEMVELE